MDIRLIGFTENNLIFIDKKRFEQVLLNLVSNAIKFTDRQGSIQIEAMNNSNRFVVVRVRDSGIGIKKKDQAKLFKMFG